MTPSSPLHATLIAHWSRNGWAGVLLRGPSGAGKSTIALRALQTGWALVADDRVVVWRSGDALFGKAPAPLGGLIEVRGVGVVQASCILPRAPIHLIADLVSGIAERMPEPEGETIAGVALPRIALALSDPDAPLRLSAALAAAQHGL